MNMIRFEGVQTPWLWAILLVAGTALLFLTYLSIFRRSQRSLTWLLLAMRGLGLLALVLALAKPTWTRETTLTDPGRLAVILDNSQSMSLADSGGKTRYALAKDALDRLKRAVDNGSGPRLVVDLFDINGAPLDGIPEQPAVERTDLARAVSETVTRLRSRPLAGVVLLSDGMDNTGRQHFRELADLPVPVHAAGFKPADNASSLDLAVRRVRAPERAMVNNEVKVDVLVGKTGGAETKATVVIKRGRDQFATQQITFAPGNSEQVVSLNVRPTQAGSFVFTASVESEAGEKLLANNAAHFPLRVDTEPIRVLYLEGFLRYEHKFLKTRLEDDPDIALVSLVRRANPDRIEPRTGKDLVTAERLKDFAVIILGDMESSYLSDAEYREIVKWLDGKGHSLLVVGGYQSFGPEGFRKTALADVLPVVFSEQPPYQSEEPFVLQLTEDGQRHPIFEVTGDRVKDAAMWKTSPHLQGSSLVLRAKPGASVLAVNPNLKIEDKPAVVIATQRFGGGHTMVLAADTTWQWSRFARVLGQPDTLYSRFWSQTIRWLSGRSLDDQRPPLVVSTDRPDYEVGKPVQVRVMRQAPAGQDFSGTEVAVEVATPAGKPVPVQVRSSTAEPDVFTGTYYGAAGGRHELTATLTDKGKQVANQAAEFLVQGSGLELAETGTNRANLQAIAASTGGVYVDVEEAEKLAEKITRKERKLTQVRRSEFWNSPWLFVFFIGAVTAEWLIRRRNHLV